MGIPADGLVAVIVVVLRDPAAQTEETAENRVAITRPPIVEVVAGPTSLVNAVARLVRQVGALVVAVTM